MRKTKSQKIALCGVLSALSVAVLLLGNLLQIGTYAAPMFASFLLLPVLQEYGARYAVLQYLTVSVLGVLLVPDKELALFYALVMGYYPILKTRLDRLHPAALRWAAKLAVFNLATLALYALLLAVFSSPALMEELAGMGGALLAAMLAVGNLAFLLCDRALVGLAMVYRRLLRPKLKRLF